MPVRKGESIDPAGTRARMLAVAGDLFYERGIQAVGVNEIADAAGVSKLTLYRHFDSKENLVAEFLRARSDRVSAWLARVADRPDLDPADRILAVFDALGEWFAEPGFAGCALVNGAVEARAATGAVREIAETHLGRHLELLRHLAQDADAEVDADALARQLLVLVEGATTVAFCLGRPDAALDARRIAQRLLASADRDETA